MRRHQVETLKRGAPEVYPAPSMKKMPPDRHGYVALLSAYRPRLVAVVLLALVGGFAEAAVLVLVVRAAVTLSEGGESAVLSIGALHTDHLTITAVLVAALVLTAVRFGVQLAASWVSARLAADVQRRLRVETFDAFVDADWSVQSEEREGRLQQLLGVEVEWVVIAVVGVTTGLAAACFLSVLIVASLIVNPVAAAALLCGVGGLFVALRPLAQAGKRHGGARVDRDLDVAHTISEFVRTSEELRVYGVGDASKRRLEEQSDQVARSVARQRFAGLIVPAVHQAAALTLMIGGLFVVFEAGGSNLAGLGAIILILMRAFTYSQQLQATLHGLGENRSSIGHLQEQLSHYRSRGARSGTVSLDHIETVTFEGVTYRYRVGVPALEEATFSVHRGEVVGVVGPSGSGKSTLGQILLRLRSPDAGMYLINRRDASDYDERDWSRLVSYVPQEPRLIAGTVSDNVRFLRTGFSDDAVEAAARLACLHDEITAWPSGYSTIVGERAGAISGGQKQRLCLARALLNRPELLLLDEATSALDAQSDHLVKEALRSVRGHTTMVIIAHRLSMLGMCDRIVVLREGRVEAVDTPTRLAVQDGFYLEALRLSRRS